MQDLTLVFLLLFDAINKPNPSLDSTEHCQTTIADSYQSYT